MRKLTVFIVISLFIISNHNHPLAREITIPDIELSDEIGDNPGQASIIIEVTGDPTALKAYIEKVYPTIKVMQTYTLLFSGLAIKGPELAVKKLAQLDFVKGIHPVNTYQTLEYSSEIPPSLISEKKWGDSTYTGKGVKIAVIDTGIDYSHPDLKTNYKGGYDLVDLDNDPMETTIEQGMATLHGTHVAGIIGANGRLKGIAPDAEIYAYRALGPGGMGSSIQVIAAMEQAVRDKVDIINLSLGNTVNGPDYPTSVAVNAASRLGVAVIVANGNAGPSDWTIGAPATASSALSVGAYEAEGETVYLYEAKTKREIKIVELPVAKKWDLSRDYQVDAKATTGKIQLIKLGDKPIADAIIAAENAGAVAVLLYDTGSDGAWQMGLQEVEFNLPVALISEKNGLWLAGNISAYLKTKTKNIQEKVTDFSSRGPVTVDWAIKPDVLAPGANIVSTVPGGYESLSGTSMATPYIAGVVAILKEAKKDWTNEQIFNAIRTTARKLQAEEGRNVEPNVQGNGLVNIEKALRTKTIIHDAPLSFGKVNAWLQSRELEVEVENLSNLAQTYYFDVPSKRQGIAWELPQEFTVEAHGKKKLKLGIKISSKLLADGIHQGWLRLVSKAESFQLPYLFINQTATYPKVMGFDVRVHPYDKDVYEYQLYVPDEVTSVEVMLYDHALLLPAGLLYKWDDLQIGMNEGTIKRRKITQRGHFQAVIMVNLTGGKVEKYETEIYLE